jgi:ribosomal protein S18 acetylase RimI-like enzyme
MKIELRPATPDDLEFARRLHHTAYRDVIVRQFGGWDEELQDSFFEEKWCPTETRIVIVGGRGVGLLQVQAQEHLIEIVEIQLLPEYQGRGIGSTLLKNELELADRAGLPTILRVLKENRARDLYSKLNFKVMGSSETHYFMERESQTRVIHSK